MRTVLRKAARCALIPHSLFSPAACCRVLTCAFAAQKRKAASKSDFPYAEWVVCINSLMLFERGVNLPEELKLSKKAVQELKAIRSCGRRRRR